MHTLTAVMATPDRGNRHIVKCTVLICSALLIDAIILADNGLERQKYVEIRDYINGYIVEKYQDGFTVFYNDDYLEDAASGYTWDEMQEAHGLSGVLYTRHTRDFLGPPCSQEPSGVWVGEYDDVEFSLVLFPSFIGDQKYQLEVYGRPVRSGHWERTCSMWSGIGETTITFMPALFRHHIGQDRIDYSVFEYDVSVGTLHIRAVKSDPRNSVELQMRRLP